MTEPKVNQSELACYSFPVGSNEAAIRITGKVLAVEDFDALAEFVQFAKKQCERAQGVATYPGKDEAKTEDAIVETVSKYCNKPRLTPEQALAYKNCPVPNGHCELAENDEVFQSSLLLSFGTGSLAWYVQDAWSPSLDGRDVKWWRVIEPGIRFCRPGCDL